jgi:hypothetical protein
MWPAQLVAERTIVIQGDDGVTSFAELAPSESFGQLRAGDRVRLIAREGFQPNHLLFVQIQPGAAAENGGAPASMPAAVASASVPADIRESPDVLIGVVDAVNPRALSLQTQRGARVEIDVTRLDADILRDLRPGDQVTVYAPMRVHGHPVASGIVVEHAQAPSALPRQ